MDDRAILRCGATSDPPQFTAADVAQVVDESTRMEILTPADLSTRIQSRGLPRDGQR